MISFHKPSRWFYFHPVAMWLEAGVGKGSGAKEGSSLKGLATLTCPGVLDLSPISTISWQFLTWPSFSLHQ